MHDRNRRAVENCKEHPRNRIPQKKPLDDLFHGRYWVAGQDVTQKTVHRPVRPILPIFIFPVECRRHCDDSYDAEAQLRHGDFGLGLGVEENA